MPTHSIHSMLLFKALVLAALLSLAAALALDGIGTSSAVPPVVLVGAGDIASCTSVGDEATADLLDAIPGTVVTLGDNAYESGTADEFTNCYEPSWGRHKGRTMPATGNHDYGTLDAAGYFAYFGAAAGDPSTGYYSYDLGAWHIVVINSNCGEVGGCHAGSDQEQWLRADLAAHPVDCTLAYWHHPRFSSAVVHGNQPYMQPIWQALFDYKADVVLSGHDHSYERFAPQTPAGVADYPHGIREFVVGTGGKSHYEITAPIANSQVQNDDTYGVIRLTLNATSYDWEFVPVAEGTFTDSGSAPCVGPDSDGDGCTDAHESGPDPNAGGSRNPNSFWDFFDTPDASNQRDRAVNIGDIARVVQRFGAKRNPPPTKSEAFAEVLTQPLPVPAYHPAFDRSLVGPNAWNVGPPDGSVTIGDITRAVLSFGHSCL